MFNLPFLGRGGLPASPGGVPTPRAPGGMFNAWPTLLNGPQAGGLPGPAGMGALPGPAGAGALPSPGGVPALPAPPASVGGFGAAISNMMKGGLAANAYALFGSPQHSDDVKAQIQKQFAAAGRPDPFAAPPSDAIPMDNVPAYGSTPMTMQAPAMGGMDPSALGMIPLPRPRPRRPEDAAAASPDYSLYSGPGSMSFGAGEGPSGNNYGQGAGILAALFGRH